MEDVGVLRTPTSFATCVCENDVGVLRTPTSFNMRTPTSFYIRRRRTPCADVVQYRTSFATCACVDDVGVLRTPTSCNMRTPTSFYTRRVRRHVEGPVLVQHFGLSNVPWKDVHQKSISTDLPLSESDRGKSSLYFSGYQLTQGRLPRLTSDSTDRRNP